MVVAAPQLFCMELRLVSVVFVGAEGTDTQNVLVAGAHPYWRLMAGIGEDGTVVLCWRGPEGTGYSL